MMDDFFVARLFRGEGLDGRAPKPAASEEAGYSRLAMSLAFKQHQIIS
jgi:hypothetical protein